MPWKDRYLTIQVYNYHVKKGTECFAVENGERWTRFNFLLRSMPENTLFETRHINMDPSYTVSSGTSSIIKQIIHKGYYAFDFLDFSIDGHSSYDWLLVLVHENDVDITFLEDMDS